MKNPAGFELLGIGLAIGLAVGIVLGFGIQKMMDANREVVSLPTPQPAEISAAISQGTSEKEREVQARKSLTAEDVKRREIQTQQTIKDWENETFNISDGGNSSPSKAQRKAWRIIDGLEEGLEE